MRLFLDIDGVLNKHKPFENRYCGIDEECRQNFNWLLAELPDMQIVLSSAWRYNVLKGNMTLAGMEELFMTHGLNVKGRIVGTTEADPISYSNNTESDWTVHSAEQWAEWGLKWRAQQILEYSRKDPVKCRAVIVDDLALRVHPDIFVQTLPTEGLTRQKAEEIFEKFQLPLDIVIPIWYH